MGQMKYILLPALLVLFFLSAVLSKPLSCDLRLCSVDAADMDNDTADDEQTPIPSGPSHLLKGITKRRIDLPALLFVTRHPIPHTPGHAFGRFCHSSAAIVYRDVLLYQALQVYRF